MFQGTGSHVGKSLIVAGLCRALARRGLSVAPFKPQNMSNNAAATPDGGEIGRAQALQALAADVPPSVHMNPVLLKPESPTGAQVIVQGKLAATMSAADYTARKGEFLTSVMDSFARVCEGRDVVIVEGAGSPAETNLRSNDIANMGFAEAAGIPVILIGDIDRGGVIASLVGTHAVLERDDRERIAGFLINKFRGDAGLFGNGIAAIETRTGWPSFGLLPWFADARRLPAEDSQGLGEAAKRPPRDGALVISVPRLPRIANFDDLDPLRAEPGVEVRLIESGTPIPSDTDLVLLPGSKSTLSDLAFLRGEGWDIDILAHWRRGGHVLGLCAGYQMLGRRITDPDGVEGSTSGADGLGLLDIETVLTADKTTRPVAATSVPDGLSISGYEIHLGQSNGPDRARPFCNVDGQPEGAGSADGLVWGTYLHGIFASDAFRQSFLARLGGERSDLRYDHEVQATLDALAGHLEQHIDIDRLLELAGKQRDGGR
jgi:adenosylcobyric acid synthase